MTTTTTTTIAIAGKGGTGKTTISALLIKILSEEGTVLAVDADPATNLNQCLGLPLEKTVGGIREQITDDVQKGRIAVGVGKQELLDSKLMESMVESKGLDLMAMGRPEGPGCYCASNHMLRISLDRLSRNYDFIVMDCEAGLEHISRQTTKDIDYLLIVSDPTIRGITVAASIKELIGELRSTVGKIFLIVNRVKGDLSAEMKQAINKQGLELVATIPEDDQVAALEEKGLPVTDLAQDSRLRIAVKEIAKKIGLLKHA
jgi:CO dehydrogenase maturation factor